MLKIKDNVDLKELEKYKLEYCEEYKYYSSKEIGCFILIEEDGEEKRIIKIADGIYEISGLNILYDLIKDGLVEKVKE